MKELSINPYEIEWEIIETMDILSGYDREVLLESEKYLATGMWSCGEIVDIYDIELKKE